MHEGRLMLQMPKDWTEHPELLCLLPFWKIANPFSPSECQSCRNFYSKTWTIQESFFPCTPLCPWQICKLAQDLWKKRAQHPWGPNDLLRRTLWGDCWNLYSRSLGFLKREVERGTIQWKAWTTLTLEDHSDPIKLMILWLSKPQVILGMPCVTQPA